MDCDARRRWNTNTPYSTWRQFYLSAQTAHAIRAQRYKALSSTPCGFMETQTSTSTHAQSHHQMREASFTLQLLFPGNKPQLPSEYETGRLPQYNEVINLDNWVLSRVTYCVEMQCVRRMFMYDWVVRTSASHWWSPGFKCRSQLPWCKIFVAILSLSTQTTGQCLNLENECFLLYFSEFIIQWPS